MADLIKIEDFAKVEMRVGLVVEAMIVEGSDKLIKEIVDIGDRKITVFSGLRKWYAPEDLLNKKFIYVVNLEPRKMPSFVKTAEGDSQREESQGMILVVETAAGERPIMLVPAEDIPVGAKVR
jgi:methionine--tRNA ligase beta chain